MVDVGGASGTEIKRNLFIIRIRKIYSGCITNQSAKGHYEKVTHHRSRNTVNKFTSD